MKKPKLHYWRTVDVDHDNHKENQCLACKGRWIGSAWVGDKHGWNFCPLCGVKFEGELDCRRHGEPKWNREWKIKRNHFAPYFYWVIEVKRHLWGIEDEGRKWDTHRILEGFVPAKDVLDDVRLARAEGKEYGDEVRVRVVREKPEGYVSRHYGEHGLWGRK